MTKTTLATKVDNQWLITDATGISLGRLASDVAFRLMGKHKPTYTPHIDQGDHVVITNSELVKLTGDKLNQKEYYHYTGYIGGLKTRTMKDIMEKDSTEIIRMAVRRMLPKGNMGRQMYAKLHVYKDAEHPHVAQQPTEFKINLKGAAK